MVKRQTTSKKKSCFGTRHNCTYLCCAGGTLHRCEMYCDGASVTHSFDGLFPERTLREGMHLRIGHWYFHDLGLVKARSMSCEHLARSVNEVLSSLWCMRNGDCYCACHIEQCGVSFRIVCLKDSEFPTCSSCGSIPMRPQREPYMCDACEYCNLALAEP